MAESKSRERVSDRKYEERSPARRTKRERSPNDYDAKHEDKKRSDYYHRDDRRHERDEDHRRDERRRDYRERRSNHYESTDRDYHDSRRREARSPQRYSDDILVNVLPLDKRPRRINQWDVSAPGFDGMSVWQAKSTGLFAAPGSNAPKAGHGHPQSISQNGNDINILNALSLGNSALVKQSRRVYVGGIPNPSSEDEIINIFDTYMPKCGFVKGGNVVVQIQYQPDRMFAFVEFRNSEEANAAMLFDGFPFKGNTLKIRRPVDYNSLIAMSDVSTLIPDMFGKILLQNLPLELSESHLREIFKEFGAILHFAVHQMGENKVQIVQSFNFCRK